MTMKDWSARSTTSHTESLSCSLSFDPDLEHLAEDLRTELEDNGLVKDQKCGLRTKICNAFTGKDAVSVLQKLMPRRTTREDAREKGTELMTEFRFFKPATEKGGDSSKELQDTASDLYVFDYNLPSAVQKVKELYSSYWDKAWLLEQHIDCKDRRHKFRTYPNCFLAKEAVDTMMALRLVRCRKEAVFMMRKLNEKVYFFQQASGPVGEEFKDDGSIYYIVPKNKRIQEPPKRHKKKRGEESSRASQGSRRSANTRSSMRSARSSRSKALTRADSVRSSFEMHREGVATAVSSRPYIPSNGPRGRQ